MTWGRMDRLIESRLATQSMSHSVTLSDNGMDGQWVEENRGGLGDCQWGELHVREKLKALVDKSQWVYAAFWATSEDDKGTLAWKDGYYNGLLPAGLDAVIYKNKYSEIGMQCRKLVADIQEIAMTGDKHNTRLYVQPDDLENTAWFYLMTMNFHFSLSEEASTFCPGPAHTWKTGEHDWIAGYDQMGDSRAQMAMAAGLQTIVCVAVQNGVLEIGTTQMVPEDVPLALLLRSVFDGEKDVRHLAEANNRLFAPAGSLHASAVFAAAIAAAVAAHAGTTEVEPQTPHRKAVPEAFLLEGKSETGSSTDKDTRSQSVSSKTTSACCRSPSVSSMSENRLQSLVDRTRSVLTILAEESELRAGEDTSAETSCQMPANQESETLKASVDSSTVSKDGPHGSDLPDSSTWWDELPESIVDNLPLHEEEPTACRSMPSCTPLEDSRWTSADRSGQDSAKESVDVDVACEWAGITDSQERGHSGQEKGLVKEGDLLMDLADLELSYTKDSLHFLSPMNPLSDPLKDWPWDERQAPIVDDDPFLTSLMAPDQVPHTVPVTSLERHYVPCTTPLHTTALAQYSAATEPRTVNHDAVPSSDKPNAKLAQSSSVTFRSEGDSSSGVSISASEAANLLVHNNKFPKLSTTNDPSIADVERHSYSSRTGIDDLDHSRRGAADISNGVQRVHRFVRHEGGDRQQNSNDAVQNMNWNHKEGTVNMDGNHNSLSVTRPEMEERKCDDHPARHAAPELEPELSHRQGPAMASLLTPSIPGSRGGRSIHGSESVSSYLQPLKPGRDGGVAMLANGSGRREVANGDEPARKRLKIDTKLGPKKWFPKLEGNDRKTFTGPMDSSTSNPLVRTTMPPLPPFVASQQPRLPPRPQAGSLQQTPSFLKAQVMSTNEVLGPTSASYIQPVSQPGPGERPDDYLRFLTSTLPPSSSLMLSGSNRHGEQCLPGGGSLPLPACAISAGAPFGKRFCAGRGVGPDPRSGDMGAPAVLHADDATLVARTEEIADRINEATAGHIVEQEARLPRANFSSLPLRSSRQLEVTSGGEVQKCQNCQNSLNKLVSPQAPFSSRWEGDLHAMTMSVVTSSTSSTWEDDDDRSRKRTQMDGGHNSNLQLASNLHSGLSCPSYDSTPRPDSCENVWKSEVTTRIYTNYSNQGWCLSVSDGMQRPSDVSLAQTVMQLPGEASASSKGGRRRQGGNFLSQREVVPCLSAVNITQVHQGSFSPPKSSIGTTKPPIVEGVCVENIPSHAHHTRQNAPLLSDQTEASTAVFQQFPKSALEPNGMAMAGIYMQAGQQFSPAAEMRDGGEGAEVIDGGGGEGPLSCLLGGLPNFQPRRQEGNGTRTLSEILNKEILQYDILAGADSYADWPWDVAGISNREALLHDLKRKWTAEGLARAILKTRAPPQSLAPSWLPNLWWSADEIPVITR